MKKKMITGLALAGIAAVSAGLAGCGGQPVKQAAVTKDSLLEKAVDTFADMKSADADIKMDLDVKMSASGFSMEMKNNTDMKLEGITDGTSHMKGHMNLVALGQNKDADIETYTVKDGNDLIQYSKTAESGSDGTWTYTVIPDGAQLTTSSGLDVSKIAEAYEKMKDAFSELTLHDGTVNYNDVDCYLMDGTITGEKLVQIMSESGQEADQTTVENAKMMNYDTALYFRASDETIYAVEMDLGKAMENMIAAQTSQNTGMDMDISAEAMKVGVIFNSFNSVNEVTVPEEVKKSAIESSEAMDIQSLIGIDI